MRRSVSLHTDTELVARYRHLVEMSQAAGKSTEGSDVTNDGFEAFYESLVTQAYESLQSISRQPLPELHLHGLRPGGSSSNSRDAEATFADWRGIHVGLSLISQLDGAIIVLSAYLMENYLWQVSPFNPETPPPGGSAITVDNQLTMYSKSPLSISEVVSLDRFPTEALSLYSAHLIPEAEARDGYQKQPFQLIMEHMQRARSADQRGVVDARTLARAIPKPLLDLADFLNRFDEDEAMQRYLHADNGAHLLRLHMRLLLDGVYFLLAHEVAHSRLGHLEHRWLKVAEIREEEADADAESIAMLGAIPDFEPRSLVILFSFARSSEKEIPPDQADHPLAHNRLLILAETLLTGLDGHQLRTDVNAGLALLQSNLEPKSLTFGWPGEAAEDVDVNISTYSDMDYTAHLMIYIDRPPHSTERSAPLWENAFLLAHLAYKIEFELRNRINPTEVYTWGGASYHPTIRPENMYITTRADTIFSRLHVSIPAPPEFCLRWPDAEFVVKNIDVMPRQPDLKGPDEQRNPVRFFYEPVRLDLKDFLESRAPQGLDEKLRARLLLAARRYSDYGRGDASVQIYQWLYRQNPESLPYGDLVDLAAQLMDAGRFAEAAEIARWALGPSRPQRPRFHFILALDHAGREEAQEAYEEMFLEMTVFGMYGEVFDKAQEMSGKIASYAGDLVMGALRTFIAHRDAGGQALKRHEPDKALAEFQAGRDALLTGQTQARRDFVFLRQALSDVTLTICELEGDGFRDAVEAAQAVLALRPDFVPALMNLATIALHRGDRDSAHELWQKAYALAPFHSIVFDRREEFELGPS